MDCLPPPLTTIPAVIWKYPLCTPTAKKKLEEKGKKPYLLSAQNTTLNNKKTAFSLASDEFRPHTQMHA